MQKPTNGEQEEGRGLIGCLAREAGVARRASSGELLLPRTFPVTHSREKFYTVCSDYALLNQAAAVRKQDDGLATPKLQAAGGGVVSDGDCEMEDMTSGDLKTTLAWEIDTSDFKAVLTRKIRTGNLKKCGTKKMKSDRPGRNLQDIPPHASLEDVKQRKVLDLRRW